MAHKLTVGALAAIVPFGILAAVALPSAGAQRAIANKTKPVVFTGKMACSLTGSIALDPAFTTDGTSSVKKATVTLTGRLKDCGGTKGFTRDHVTITGGRISATGSVTNSSGSANSCVAIALGGTLPKISGSATFTAKGGKAEPTKFEFSEGSFASGPPITVTYPASGAKATATGSFAGTKGGAAADVKQSISDLLTECGSSSGLTALVLASGTATFG